MENKNKKRKNAVMLANVLRTLNLDAQLSFIMDGRNKNREENDKKKLFEISICMMCVVILVQENGQNSKKEGEGRRKRRGGLIGRVEL